MDPLVSQTSVINKSKPVPEERQQGDILEELLDLANFRCKNRRSISAGAGQNKG
jgi:hypothetical protein